MASAQQPKLPRPAPFTCPALHWRSRPYHATVSSGIVGAAPAVVWSMTEQVEKWGASLPAFLFMAPGGLTLLPPK